MKKWLQTIALLSVLLAVLGCSNNSASKDAIENNNDAESKSGQDAGQTLIIADQEIAASLDPVKPLTSSYLVALGVGEALFKVNAEGEVEPSLAESATPVDATTWTIKLRNNARFWSGQAIDADAMIASLMRSLELDLRPSICRGVTRSGCLEGMSQSTGKRSKSSI